MKLITLNIWGGHLAEPLLSFFEEKRNVDVFCLQEVYYRAKTAVSDDARTLSLDIFSQIQRKLPDHRGYFKPVLNHSYGIATFVRKDLEISQEGAVSVYSNPSYSGMGPSHSRDLQWIQIVKNEQLYTVFNLHGLWNGRGKGDSAERIEQAKKVRDTMCLFEGQKILCGDFNLKPTTESMKIMEVDLHNLVRLYGITSTRTSYYPKEERFADYVLTSPRVMIHDFKVLGDEVSDHSPLYVEFS
ncbi:MAG: endonuclease/exonuclease/phosphatase family protein [Bdellovibrio sp.]|nr:endonuclease/exonuclease/phosphatase family protein [Bdellovibrio sp.]